VKKRPDLKGKRTFFDFPDVDKCNEIKALRDNIKSVLGHSGKKSKADLEFNYQMCKNSFEDYLNKIKRGEK
jgi:hypothetical protein